MPTLGVITVGQAPRDDLVPEMLPLLPEGVPVVQHGALDGLSATDIARLAPRDGEEPLTSRLADGGSAVFGHDQVMPLVQQTVRRAEDDGADLLLLACSGAFPPLESRAPLLHAEALAQQGAAALSAGRRLGIIRPLPDQLEEGRNRWRRMLPDVPEPVTAAASPYTGGVDAVADAAAELSERCDLLVLDCIGYDKTMRAAAARAAGKPVVSVRNVAARLAAELLQP